MNGPERMRDLLAQPGPIICPGCYDCFTARIVERAGFPMTFMSGTAVCASVLGYPDMGLQTMTEIWNQARNIARSVSIPVIADADTGYGNALNVIRTVREFESTGLAGIMIEDQLEPKRCGHYEGKRVIPTAEMVIKIEAACEARRNDNFVLVARSDLMGMADFYELEERYYGPLADSEGSQRGEIRARSGARETVKRRLPI